MWVVTLTGKTVIVKVYPAILHNGANEMKWLKSVRCAGKFGYVNESEIGINI